MAYKEKQDNAWWGCALCAVWSFKKREKKAAYGAETVRERDVSLFRGLLKLWRPDTTVYLFLNRLKKKLQMLSRRTEWNYKTADACWFFSASPSQLWNSCKWLFGAKAHCWSVDGCQVVLEIGDERTNIWSSPFCISKIRHRSMMRRNGY